MNKLFVLLALIIGLAACTSGEQREQLSRVNELNQTLDTVKEIYHSQDSVSISQLFHRAQKNSELLDQVPAEHQNQELIQASRNAERVYRRYLANYDRLKDELNYSYEQLENLESDIRSEHIEPEMFPHIIREEEKAVKRLHENLVYIVEEIEKENKSADSLQNEIKNHLDGFELFE